MGGLQVQSWRAEYRGNMGEQSNGKVILRPRWWTNAPRSISHSLQQPWNLQATHAALHWLRPGANCIREYDAVPRQRNAARCNAKIDDTRAREYKCKACFAGRTKSETDGALVFQDKFSKINYLEAICNFGAVKWGESRVTVKFSFSERNCTCWEKPLHILNSLHV